MWNYGDLRHDVEMDSPKHRQNAELRREGWGLRTVMEPQGPESWSWKRVYLYLA